MIMSVSSTALWSSEVASVLSKKRRLEEVLRDRRRGDAAQVETLATADDRR